VTGGGARSPLWRQILADVFGAEIVTVNTTEGAAYGAALLAGTGAGVFSSVESACEATIQITGKTSPGKNQDVYERLYPLYRDLYPALTPTFHAQLDIVNISNSRK
jgi:xylulokinase